MIILSVSARNDVWCSWLAESIHLAGAQAPVHFAVCTHIHTQQRKKKQVQWEGLNNPLCQASKFCLAKLSHHRSASESGHLEMPWRIPLDWHSSAISNSSAFPSTTEGNFPDTMYFGAVERDIPVDPEMCWKELLHFPLIRFSRIKEP